MAAESRGQPFGHIAQELGFVVGFQVLEALDRQRVFAQMGRGRRPIGVHLVELGYLTGEQVGEVLSEMERRERAPMRAVAARRTRGGAPPRRFGEIALDLGYVTERDVAYALELQRVTRFWGREARPIGLLLVGMGALSLGQVDQVLEVLSEERARLAAAQPDTVGIAVAAENVRVMDPPSAA